MKTKQQLTLLLILVSTGLCAQSLPSYLPSNGLVGWWPFNGNANDESGNGNHGVVNGATLTTDRQGNLNSSYDFDGIDDYIHVSNFGFNDQYLTISCWVKVLNYQYNSPGFQQSLYYFGTETGPANTYTTSIDLTIDGVNYSPAFLRTNLNYNYGFCGQTTNNTSWLHVISVLDGVSNLLKFYINGTLVNSCPVTPNSIIINPADVNNFGASFNFTLNQVSNFFKGNLDDIGIWNRALTQQEITSLYEGCVKPEPVSLSTNRSAKLCPNESVTIKIVSPADSLGYQYQWTRNGTNVPGATLRTITVNDAAKYKVFVQSGTGANCQRVSGLVETIAATPPDIRITYPNGTSYCPGDSVLLTASGATAGYNYQWKRFGVPIAGATSSNFYAKQAGNYRCEATNAGGCVAQSNIISVTNGPASYCAGGTLTTTDIDGNIYPVVQIGNKMWMAENLKTTKYSNGDLIIDGLSAASWYAPSFDTTLYGNRPVGYKYNWEAVDDPRGLCPAGWHVANNYDWRQLYSFIGSYDTTCCYQYPNVYYCLSAGIFSVPLNYLGPNANLLVNINYKICDNSGYFGLDLFGFNAVPIPQESMQWWSSTHYESCTTNGKWSVNTICTYDTVLGTGTPSFLPIRCVSNQ